MTDNDFFKIECVVTDRLMSISILLLSFWYIVKERVYEGPAGRYFL